MKYLLYKVSHYFLIIALKLLNTQENRSQHFFFIVSAGRSGSTLLRKILTSKYKVHIPPESGDLMVLLGRYFVMQKVFGKNIVSTDEIIIPKIKKTLEAQRWNMDIIRLKGLITASGKLLHPRICITNIYEHHLQSYNPNAVLIGDKTPFLVLHLNLLEVIFPNLKVVHLLRDGRKVVKSRLGNFSENLDTATLRWIWAVEESEKFARNNYGKFLEIKYEDLVEDIHGTLTQLENFLELTLIKREEEFRLQLEDDILPHHRRLNEKIEIIESCFGADLDMIESKLQSKFRRLLSEKGYC